MRTHCGNLSLGCPTTAAAVSRSVTVPFWGFHCRRGDASGAAVPAFWYAALHCLLQSMLRVRREAWTVPHASTWSESLWAAATAEHVNCMDHACDMACHMINAWTIACMHVYITSYGQPKSILFHPEGCCYYMHGRPTERATSRIIWQQSFERSRWQCRQFDIAAARWKCVCPRCQQQHQQQ